MKISLQSAQFKSVLNHSTIQSINNLQFYYSESLNPKIGFIVSRKLGSSIERNKFKRSCRLLFLVLCNNLNKNFSLIVWPQNPLHEYSDLTNVFSLLKKKICND